MRSLARKLTPLLLPLVALSLLAGGCGIATDDSPVEISNDALVDELVRGRLPTPAPTVAEFNFQIYMVDEGNRLALVSRNVDLESEVSDINIVTKNAIAIMRELLLGPTRDEKALGIDTALTRGTDLETITIDPDTRVARVILTPGSLDQVVGNEQRIALAQIVYSLTTRGTINAVSFAIGTEELAVQTDRGTTVRGAAVTRADFASLDPSNRPTIGFPDPSQETPEPVPTPSPEPTNRFELELWMISDEGRLTSITRRLERDPVVLLRSLTEVLSPDEAQLGLRSALLPGVLDVRIDRNEDSNTFGTAFVDLAEGSLPGFENNERLLAVAQVVFTLTGLVEISEVAFSVEGVYAPVPTEQGLTLPYEPGVTPGLTRVDYAALAPAGTPLGQLRPAEGESADDLADPTPTPEP